MRGEANEFVIISSQIGGAEKIAASQLPEETLTRKSENSSVSATRARQTALKWASAWTDEAVLLICMRHR